jgi:hypothetical protein
MTEHQQPAFAGTWRRPTSRLARAIEIIDRRRQAEALTVASPPIAPAT